eukprot:2937953-Pyramimonas_sp.AAC.1
MKAGAADLICKSEHGIQLRRPREIERCAAHQPAVPAEFRSHATQRRREEDSIGTSKERRPPQTLRLR